MIGFSLLALLAPAAAATATPATAPRYVMDVAEGKVVCRSVSVAHSRIPERVCRTELQWEEMARETQDELKKRNRAVGHTGG